jgi:hypothetical protein
MINAVVGDSEEHSKILDIPDMLTEGFWKSSAKNTLTLQMQTNHNGGLDIPSFENRRDMYENH